MYTSIHTYCKEHEVTLVVVSKMRRLEEVEKIYNEGHRLFAENRVQDLLEKYEALPKDIQWHLIGTLQTNKVKYIAPFISLIHSVDDVKLWSEINKQARRHHRIIPCLLQIKIASEETKSGFKWPNLVSVLEQGDWRSLDHAPIVGVMGMASFTEDQDQIQKEFKTLVSYYDQLKSTFFKYEGFKIKSMGMSGDYKLAISCGSNMVRVGSAVFT